MRSFISQYFILNYFLPNQRNWKMKKTARVLFFCVLFVFLFNTIQIIITPFWKYGTDGLDGESDRYSFFYNQPSYTLDYLTLGVSHTFYSINPMQIYAESGITGYDLGSANQPIDVSYYWLKEACKTQKPLYLFLDVKSLLYEKKDIYSAGISKALIYMRPSLNKIGAMWNCRADGQTFWELAFPLLQFHDRWSSLNEDDWNNKTSNYFLYGSYLRFTSRLDIGKDFLDLNHTENYRMEGNILEKKELFQDTISSHNRKYFEKIIDLCNENGILLVPTKFPTMNWTRKEAQSLETFLSDYNLELLDLSNGKDFGIDWEEDTEYSCAMKSHFRKSGNQMSGKWKSSYASLLA